MSFLDNRGCDYEFHCYYDTLRLALHYLTKEGSVLAKELNSI